MRFLGTFVLTSALAMTQAVALYAQRPERFVLSDSVVLFDVGAPDPLPTLIYMTDAEGVYVRRYVNSYARIHPRSSLSFSVDQVYSPSQGVKLRIADVNQAETPISLRICQPSGSFRLYLNGHEADFPCEGGYIVIRRVWSPQDEMWIDVLQD